MAVVGYTLLMKKTAYKDATAPAMNTGVKSSFDDFGFVTSEIEWPDIETEDVVSRTWAGEDGEDVYLPPSGLDAKAYDLEVEMIYKGEPKTAVSAFNSFREYLLGKDDLGAEMNLYDPYWGIGRSKVYVEKISDIEAAQSDIDEVVGMKVTFRVTDPLTSIELKYGETGVVGTE